MNILFTIIILYIISSFLEWYIHRYLMHKTDNEIINNINYIFQCIYRMIHSNINQDYSHIEHHKVVDNNGNVNIDDDGMFFCKKNIIIPQKKSI